MSIETTCPGCNRKLSVPREHAGRQARCPVCGAAYQVFEAAAPPESAQPSTAAADSAVQQSSAPAPPCWLLQTPEGQTYGPVTKEELDGWVAQGRVTASCQIQQQGETDFLAGDHFYAALRDVPSSRNAPVAIREKPPATQLSKRAHRGTLILLMGLMGFVMFCPVMSVIAWVLGVADLREMRSGRMDRQGLGMTQAGQVLGTINSVLWITAAVITLLILLLMAAYS